MRITRHNLIVKIINMDPTLSYAQLSKMDSDDLIILYYTLKDNIITA